MSIHPQIIADTVPLCETTNAAILLMNDSRWPWVVLVPTVADINELHDLTHEQRNQFMADVNQVSRVVQHQTGCKSVNVAMLGNIVSQLHCHVVARNETDPAWPGPVWGFGLAVAYDNNWPDRLITALRKSFT